MVSIMTNPWTKVVVFRQNDISSCFTKWSRKGDSTEGLLPLVCLSHVLGLLRSFPTFSATSFGLPSQTISYDRYQALFKCL